MTTNEEKEHLTSLIDQLRALSAHLSHHLDTSDLDDQIDELANEIGSIEPDDGETAPAEGGPDLVAPGSGELGQPSRVDPDKID